MSKESKNQKNALPMGMRDLVDLVTSDFSSSNKGVAKNVPENKVVENGTFNNPVTTDGKKVDFREFLDYYKENAEEFASVYVPLRIKFVLERLKNTPELRRYAVKHILSALLQAYFVEHKEELEELLQTKQNGGIFD